MSTDPNSYTHTRHFFQWTFIYKPKLGIFKECRKLRIFRDKLSGLITFNTDTYLV